MSYSREEFNDNFEKFIDKPLEERKKLYEKVVLNYPEYIPIIIERNKRTDPVITKNKYLVSCQDSFAKIVKTIRPHIQCGEEQSLFFIINNKMPQMNQTIGNLHKQNKSEDGFLYVTYSLENTFG